MLNKEGKVFGKINIIDLFVVVLIAIVIIAAGLVGVRKYESTQASKISGVENKVTTMYVTVQGEGVIGEIGENFIVGDNLVVGNVLLSDEEVVAVSIEPFKKYTHTADGELVLFDHPYLKTVEVVVKGKQNPNNVEWKINGKEARVGNMVFIKTRKALLSGRITNIEFKD